MQNNNECLNEAMFMASESYSGTAYEGHLDGPCDDIFAFVPEPPMADAPALAA